MLNYPILWDTLAAETALEEFTVRGCETASRQMGLGWRLPHQRAQPKPGSLVACARGTERAWRPPSTPILKNKMK